MFWLNSKSANRSNLLIACSWGLILFGGSRTSSGCSTTLRISFMKLPSSGLAVVICSHCFSVNLMRASFLDFTVARFNVYSAIFSGYMCSCFYLVLNFLEAATVGSSRERHIYSGKPAKVRKRKKKFQRHITSKHFKP